MTIRIYLFTAIFGMLLFISACSNAQTAKNVSNDTAKAVYVAPVNADTVLPGDRVELVYFHTKESCHCMSVVKDNLKYALEKNFSRELASGRIKFTTIVSDDPANAQLLQAYDAMLFSLYIKEIREEGEKVELVNEIWNMTGDENKEKLAEFIRFKLSPMLTKGSS